MFGKYFKMTEKDAIKYIKEKLDFFEEDEKLTCEEIGDGNINYIFRICSEDSNKSIILKQGDNKTRSGGSVLSRDRNKREAEMLILENKLAPGMAPEVYLNDEIMSCFAMEDLSDYEIMRTSLNKFKTIKRFSENIRNFIIKTLYPTTDLIMSQLEKKDMVKKFINPELCDITERLVYTEPFTNISGNNIVTKENKKFVDEILYTDQKLHLEVAKLKNDFMTNAQALIHGDLHTGSIFVRDDSIKAIDPEFAFYGPIGYDLGNVIGNLFFANIRAYVMKDSVEEDISEFTLWATDTIIETVNLFKIESVNYLENKINERMAKTRGYITWYIKNILADTAGVAGLEILRRIVGEAKVSDIDSINNKEGDKTKAERIGIILGKALIMNRHDIKKGEAYIKLYNKAIEEEKKWEK